MVEAIGWKAASVVTKVTPTAASTPVAAVATPASNAVATASAASGASTETTAGATGLARTMAAAPPVDADRVATIKAAIAAGKFPILPSTIADRLIALKLNWNPNAEA